MKKEATNVMKLNPEEHGELKINISDGHAHLAMENCSDIVVQEISEIATSFPIVFLRDEASGEFRLSALLGLVGDQNLFVKPTGEWEAAYIPSGVSLLPFSFFIDPAEEDVLRLDLNSELLSQDTGTSLYKDGKPSEYLSDINTQINSLSERFLHTQEFIDKLVNKNLLQEFSYSLKSANGEELIVRDIYTINSDEFNYMSDDDIMEFHKLNYWNAIYIIHHSLSQLKNLQRLYNKRFADKTMDMTITLVG